MQVWGSQLNPPVPQPHGSWLCPRHSTAQAILYAFKHAHMWGKLPSEQGELPQPPPHTPSVGQLAPALTPHYQYPRTATSC